MSPGTTARRRVSRGRGEVGAVAILVGVFAMVMFVLAALVVDLGVARDQRLQAQGSADAAALAAGNELYRTGSLNVAGAVDAATTYGTANYGITASEWSSCADANRPGGFTPVTGKTPCVSFSPNLTAPTEVRVVMPLRDSKTSLAVGTNVSKVVIGAAAQARVEAAAVTGEGGLRPWGICSAVATTSGNVTFVPTKGGSVGPKDLTDPCGTTGPPGGWWVAQCYADQGNGNGETDRIVREGCAQTDYSAVGGQPTGTSTQLYNYLAAACPSKAANNTCLSSDPGNNFHNSSDSWQALVGRRISMPVFCFPPTCSQAAVQGSGNNASYSIYRIATVTICGFQFKPRAASTGWPTTGPCATNNPKGYSSSDVTTGGGFFLVIEKLEGAPTGTWTTPQPPSNPYLSR